MKKKIALLLAIVMIFSLIPANLFAAAGISVPLNDSTEGRTDAYGSEMFTVTINMTQLRGQTLDPPVPARVVAAPGIPMFVELTGASADNLRFPRNNQWAARWDQPHPALGPNNGQIWPLEVDASNTTGVIQTNPAGLPAGSFNAARRFVADFYRVSDQTGWIVLDIDLVTGDDGIMAGLPALQNNLDAANWMLSYVQGQQNQFNAVTAAVALLEAAMNAWMVDSTTWADTDLETAAQDAWDNLDALLTTLDLATAIPAFNIPGTVPAVPAVLVNLNTTRGNFDAAATVVLDAAENALLAATFALAEAATAWPPVTAAAVVTALGTVAGGIGSAAPAVANNLIGPAVPGPTGFYVSAVETAINALTLDPVVQGNPLLATWPIIPGGAAGFLDIEVPVERVRHADSQMTVRLGHQASTTILAQGPLANFTDRGITVEPGTVTVFEHTAILDTLTIRENSAGALTRPVPGANRDRSVAIRLIAPPGYTWERAPGRPGHDWNSGTSSNGNLPNTVRRMHRENQNNSYWVFDANSNPLGPAWSWNAANQFAYNSPSWPGSPFITSPMNILQFHCTVDGVYTRPDGRQEMLIIFDNLMRDPNFPLIPGQLQLSNLRLSAGPNAPAVQEEVRIHVHVGHVCALGYVGWEWTYPNPIQFGVCSADGGPEVPATPAPAPPSPQAPGSQVRPSPAPPAQDEQAPTVATPACFHFYGNFWHRFPTSLAQVTNANRPEGDTTGLALDWRNIGYRNNVHVARRAEAGLTLALGGNPVDLRSGSVTSALTPPGNSNLVRTGRTQPLHIVEEVAGALAMSPGHPITFTFPEGVQVVGINYSVTGGRLGAQSQNAYQAFVNTARFTAPNVVTISNPMERVSAAQRMEVTFDISVEAGFAAKHNTTDIEVTVSGAGVGLLPQNGVDNVIAVAQVHDPVEVTFPSPITVPALGLEHNLLARTPFGDIVIEETDGGMLGHNDTIEIFIMRSYIQRDWDITLVPGTIVVEGDTGLAVSGAQTLNVLRGGVRVIGVTLTVTSESRSNTDGGTIRLNGNDIFGHVYPGENYWIVVSGNTIAANHSILTGASQINAPNTANHNRAIPGIFTTLPYYGRLIDYVEGFGEGPERHQANSLAGRTFSPATMVDGAPEMIWHRAPGMVHQGGFVGLRAFAGIAGVSEDNINWVPSTRVATISGWTWDHQWVTITMTQGSPWAQISLGTTEGSRDLGTTRVDIAEFSDGLTGPTGTVVPVFQNNRIYVPFRFVFNAFGYSADYGLVREGNVARVVPN